jgi:hypothetical protein
VSFWTVTLKSCTKRFFKQCLNTELLLTLTCMTKKNQQAVESIKRQIAYAYTKLSDKLGPCLPQTKRLAKSIGHSTLSTEECSIDVISHNTNFALLFEHILLKHKNLHTVKKAKFMIVKNENLVLLFDMKLQGFQYNINTLEEHCSCSKKSII